MQKQTLKGLITLVIGLAAVLLILTLLSSPAPEGHEHASHRQVGPKPRYNPEKLETQRQGLLPLGISTVTPLLPEDRKVGVRVALLAPDGPAGRAGVKPGDLITAFADRPLPSSLHLAILLFGVQADKAYPMQIVRIEPDKSGKPVERTLKLSVTGITPLPPEERLK